MTDEIKIAEEIVVLLLGVDKRPLKGEIHLQKEIFLLTKANPKLQSLFNFKKHVFGPYSQLLADIMNAPLYHDRSFDQSKNNISLTSNGESEYESIKNRGDSKKIVSELEKALFLIRTIYDKLSIDEFLFLIYASYPEYLEKSAASEKLFSKRIKEKMISGLRSKGVVTESRANELLKVNV